MPGGKGFSGPSTSSTPKSPSRARKSRIVVEDSEEGSNLNPCHEYGHTHAELSEQLDDASSLMHTLHSQSLGRKGRMRMRLVPRLVPPLYIRPQDLSIRIHLKQNIRKSRTNLHLSLRLSRKETSKIRRNDVSRLKEEIKGSKITKTMKMKTMSATESPLMNSMRKMRKSTSSKKIPQSLIPPQKSNQRIHHRRLRLYLPFLN